MGLPREAAVWREEVGQWSQQDELLATLIETTVAMAQLQLAAWGIPKRNLPEVPEIEHPDRKTRSKPKPTGLSDIQRFFSRLN